MITFAILLTLTLTVGMVEANQPGIPNAIVGTATIENGETAPVGLEIVGQIQQQTYTTQVQDDGEFNLIIENPNQNNNGNTITLFVEDQQVATITFSNEQTVHYLDIEATHVAVQEEDEEDSGTGASGGSGSSGGSGGSGGAVVTSEDEEGVEDESETTTGSGSSSTTTEETEDTEEETQTGTGDTTTSDEESDSTIVEEEETQPGILAGFLAPITGFVTGAGEGAGLMGFFLLLLIFIGLIGGYLYYKN